PQTPGPEGFIAARHGPGGPWVFAFGEDRGNRFFTDQAGAFVQDVDYQPFGKATSTGAQPHSHLYSNEQWNGGDALAAFGISQLGARLYDPALGRFISRDPLLIPRTATTTNAYAFAFNDPVNLSDPSGLAPPGAQDQCDELDPRCGGGGGPAVPDYDIPDDYTSDDYSFYLGFLRYRNPHKTPDHSAGHSYAIPPDPTKANA